MVYQIIQSKHRIFAETLILTVLIMMIGFAIGYAIESARTNSVIKEYKNFELGAMDLRLQNYYYQTMNEASCDSAIEQNFVFADQIYDTGLKLERYEQANVITDSILLEKKRYVLLKTELWLNSILLKEKCGDVFDTVVYFYAHNTDVKKDAEQQAISIALKNVKENKGNSIILIPIAGDMELNIVEMQTRTYGINRLPSLLINEKVIMEGFQSEEEIEKYLN